MILFIFPYIVRRLTGNVASFLVFDAFINTWLHVTLSVIDEATISKMISEMILTNLYFVQIIVVMR